MGEAGGPRRIEVMKRQDWAATAGSIDVSDWTPKVDFAAKHRLDLVARIAGRLVGLRHALGA
jgi:hypothetical protein